MAVENLSRIKIQNKIKKFLLYIVPFEEKEENRVLIPGDMIYEFNTKFSYSNLFVSGKVVFKDDYGVFGMLNELNEGFYLKMEATDSMGIQFSQYYRITNYNRTPQNTSLIVSIEFMDEIFYFLNNMYVSMGFSGKSILEIINEVLAFGSSVFKNGKSKFLAIDEGSSLEKIENLLIPGNKSLYQWIVQQSLLRDFFVYNRRTHLRFEPRAEIWKNAESSNIVLQPNMNIEGPFSITNYEIVSAPLEFNSLRPYTAWSFQNENTNLMVEVGSLGNSLGIIDEGIKSVFFEYGLRNTTNTQKALYEKMVLEKGKIVVSLGVGTFLYDIGMKVKVDVPIVNSEFDGRSMIGVSGEYMIAGVEDYIINGCFSQKLLLVRPGK